MKTLEIISSCTGANKYDIERFENENSICLPDDYKDFLRNINAINTAETLFVRDKKEFWLASFYPFDEGHLPSVQSTFNNLSDFFENKYIAFADDAGGWQFVISIDANDFGKVYFCRMDEALEDALSLISDSFTDFIDGLEKYNNFLPKPTA